MKQVFWTTVFWLVAVAGFLGYLKWFDSTNLGPTLAAYVIEMPVSSQETEVSTGTELPIMEETGVNLGSGSFIQTGIIVQTGITSVVTPVQTTTSTLSVEDKFAFIQQQLKDIAEKLDVQNSNTPDAVNISLKTTKKTNVRIYPLDGSTYKKYVINPSDDILTAAMNILFEKSAFTVTDTRLDGDGNLTIQLARVPGSAFGGSAAVEQVRTSIEKTALQFPQIKKVIITPDTVLQP
ncbi:MAG: hypothetical protein WCO66_02610 [Candidatus Absconditabacteria bacterium]